MNGVKDVMGIVEEEVGFGYDINIVLNDFLVEDVEYLEEDDIDEKLLNNWEATVEDFENSGTQIIKFGNQSLVLASCEDKYCEVHNYADIYQFDWVLDHSNIKYLSSVHFSPVENGIKFMVCGKDSNNKTITDYGFIPVYSEQNGYYSSALDIIKSENDKLLEETVTAYGKEIID